MRKRSEIWRGLSRDGWESCGLPYDTLASAIDRKLLSDGGGELGNTQGLLERFLYGNRVISPAERPIFAGACT